jgi:hypothetical protein
MARSKVPNRISVVMSEEDVTTALGGLLAAKSRMPFLVGLTDEERRVLPRIGDRDRAFIDKAFEVAGKVADYLPASFKIEEMRKDIALMDALSPIILEVSQLAQKLADTYSLAASEAYAAALLIYRYAKDAKGIEGLDKALDDLSQRFERRTVRTTDGETKAAKKKQKKQAAQVAQTVPTAQTMQPEQK